MFLATNFLHQHRQFGIIIKSSPNGCGILSPCSQPILTPMDRGFLLLNLQSTSGPQRVRQSRKTPSKGLPGKERLYIEES
jgi:hypothetical protein